MPVAAWKQSCGGGLPTTGGRLKRMEIYRFGLFELDAEGGELRRDGLLRPLQEQPLALLLLLLRRRGEVVSREEIRQALWPPDVHLEIANSLNAAVSRLRSALGDTAGQPRFVATVPRRGYRFIAPVAVIRGTDAAAATESGHISEQVSPLTGTAEVSKAPSRPSRGLAVSAALLLLVLFVLLGVWRSRSTVPSPSSASQPTASGVVSTSASTSAAARPFDPAQDGQVGAAEAMRLAVLPLATFSSDSDQDFIADGLTEELIGRLGTLHPERLAVIARTSVMPYKGSQVGVQQIAEQLDVDYLLEGSLRRQQDAVWITLRLIRVADQTQLWQRQFERRLGDLIELQRTISQDVAASLALELLEGSQTVGPDGRGDRQPGSRGTASSAEAYELFLRGQYLLNQRTRHSIEKALASFERAAELDPELVAAQVGIAQAWILAGVFDAALPLRAKDEAMQAIDRVLELEPGNSAGLLARAVVRFVFEWRWREAEADFLAVLERSPNLAEAHQVYSSLLLSQGRYEEALDRLADALTLDPMSLVLRTDQCWYLFHARRFEAAAERCRQTLEMDPQYMHAQDNLKWILIRAGKEPQAIEAFLRLLELEGEDESALQHFRRVAEEDGLQGMLDETIRYRALRAEEDPDAVVPYDQALDAAAAGRKDLAIEWLRKSLARRETDLAFLGVDPRFDSLRSDTRFRQLLRQIQSQSADLAPTSR